MKLFTPEEANAALSRVRPLAERLARLHRAFTRIEGGAAAAQSQARGNGHAENARRAAALDVARDETVQAIGDVLGALAELGVQVKDPATGLIDFPARHPDGSIVLLCWRLGEDAVSAWHTLDGGFAGRKPLPF